MKKTGIKELLYVMARNICVSFAVSFTIIFSNILDAFLHNATEFELVLSELTKPLLISMFIGGGITLLILTAAELLLRKGSPILFGLILGVTVASWLQINVLNGVLDALDGTKMDFSITNSNSIIGIAIWMVCIFGAMITGVILKQRIKTVACLVLTALVTMQASALVLGANDTTDAAFSRSGLYMDNSDQFQLGSDHNIIMLIFDTYSNELFDGMLAEHPEYKDIFADFTCFTNANSVYQPTYPSVLHMITGYPIDLAIGTGAAQKEAWSADQTIEYYRLLQQKGYTLSLYGIPEAYIGLKEDMYGKLDNIRSMSESVSINYDVLSKNLLALGLYRVLPYPMKGAYWAAAYDQTGVVSFATKDKRLSKNYLYYERLIQNGVTINDGEKRIIVHHLDGVHAPYTTTERCEATEDGTVQQAAIGCMTLMEAYIDELISKNIYDSSTIFFIADHGDGTYFQPMVLLKRPYEKHDVMEINKAPITFNEVMPTVLQMAGVAREQIKGTTFADISEDVIRKRVQYCRTTDNNYPLVPRYNGTDVGKRNVYYVYYYSGDRNDLLEKSKEKPDEIIPMVDTLV